MADNTDIILHPKRAARHCPGVNKPQAGFTLIEVLIALTIVGMALPALMLNVQSVSDNTSYLEEKTYAYWIAENRIQEIMLQRKVTQVLPKARQNDTIEYGGRDWFWQVDTQSTSLDGLFRVEVKVGLERDVWLATIAGFLYE